jgi:hypothetical protein
MKKRLVAIGLLLAMAATGAVADTEHYATASTQKEAKQLATAEARATAKDVASCYRPARQVRECQQVEGGFRCRAETSDSYRTCKRAGWVDDYTKTEHALGYDPWRTSVILNSGSSSSWPSSNVFAPPTTTLYGRRVPVDSGPPAATPFPSN